MKERKKKSRGRKAIPGNLAQWAVQLEEKKKNKRKKKEEEEGKGPTIQMLGLSIGEERKKEDENKE
jgi:hypothetical protein